MSEPTHSLLLDQMIKQGEPNTEHLTRDQVNALRVEVEALRTLIDRMRTDNIERTVRCITFARFIQAEREARQ
jgi:hypothetical protein